MEISASVEPRVNDHRLLLAIASQGLGVGFPVTLMWRFRVASLGIQAVMWATLGILFGWLTERDGKWQQLQN